MRILVILASGIGNSILFSPALLSLRKAYPKACIDIFARKKAFAEPFLGSSIINKIFYYEGLKTFLLLRKQKYDVSITAFPSNKWQFNLFAFLVGAKKRITHSYKVGRFRTLSFLQNCKIPADENLHDVDQNMNLLKSLNMKLTRVNKLHFYIGRKNEKFAEYFIKKNNLKQKYLVGVHTGCNKKNKYRRWPGAHFVELINKLAEQHKKIMLFAGPDEVIETDKIYRQIKHQKSIFLVKESDLKNTAALISRCKLFICTDSGLGHIATALNVNTLAIFGPAQASRTSPYGRHGNYVSLKLPCSHCLKYPFNSTSTKIRCNEKFRCLRELDAGGVLEAIQK